MNTEGEVNTGSPILCKVDLLLVLEGIKVDLLFVLEGLIRDLVALLPEMRGQTWVLGRIVEGDWTVEGTISSSVSRFT